MLKRHQRSEQKLREDPLIAKRPTADDFTAAAVHKAVLSQTLQHPASIYPWAISLVAVAWSLAINASPEAVGVALGAFFIGASAWIWNYFVRGEKLAGEHVHALRERRARFGLREAESIEADCKHARFLEGAKEARELAAAYRKLRGYLTKKAHKGSSLSAERFLTLAEDTYEEGVTILRKALRVFQALEEIDVDILERERAAWQREFDELQASSSETRRDVLQRQISAHTRRIGLYRERAELIRRLMAESNELETVLETAYLEVVNIVGDDVSSIFRGDGAGTQLERAVRSARKVEEKLSGIDTGLTRADDEMYLKAGQHSNSR